MRRTIAPIVGILVSLSLAACGSSTTTVAYTLAFNLPDPASQQDLGLAAMRVIERRLDHMGEALIDKEVRNTNGEMALLITVSDPAVATLLTDELQTPLNFQIMEEVPVEEADIVITGQGGFKATGVDSASLYAAIAQEDDDGKGVITLQFSPEGREKLSAVFRKNKGKNIGLFIRGKLTSKLLVETNTLKDDIVIRDLPSPEIARIFADDLNVGLHITFTPAP